MTRIIASLRAHWLLTGLCLALLGVLPVLLWQAAEITRQRVLAEIRDESRRTLNLTVANLRGELHKYETLPQILATNEEFRRILSEPSSDALVGWMNRYLEYISAMTGALDTYIMDPGGLTLAASNWNTEKPFVGRNFSYRPYFQDAMRGQLGRYFALGTTSNKRGYYFAYPVRHYDYPAGPVGAALGTVVVKVGVGAMETAWSEGRDEIIVIDPNGVVFMASRPDWKFNTLRALSDDDLARMATSRQYSDAALTPFPLLHETAFDADSALIRVGAAGPGAGGDRGRVPNREYLVQAVDMPEAGWQVRILADTGAVGPESLRSMAIVGSGFVILLMAVAYGVQRRQAYQARVRLQIRAKDELERKVQERTADLAAANERLALEVAERKAAEQELRQAQGELIQTSKLAALGQMSAGMSHELNQPLAAIRSFADNARTLIACERVDEANGNLTQISALTDRMARIIKNLRLFARKDTSLPVPVSLGEAIDEATALLQPRIAESGARIRKDVPPGALWVNAGPVRLQQVLTNLIGNALDAVNGCAAPEIHIAARARGESIELTVRDTGPGIPDEHLTSIFDPFFTTKEVNEGLGLGLSLSYGIVQSFDGSIRAANHPDGGAVFTVTLRRPLEHRETA